LAAVILEVVVAVAYPAEVVVAGESCWQWGAARPGQHCLPALPVFLRNRSG